jgi:hypothetical protein
MQSPSHVKKKILPWFQARLGVIGLNFNQIFTLRTFTNIGKSKLGPCLAVRGCTEHRAAGAAGLVEVAHEERCKNFGKEN